MSNYSELIQQSYVGSALCRLLLAAGLEVTAPFCWDVTGKHAVLITNAFDEDGYYAAAIEAKKLVKDLVLVPAFQTGDMIKLLPDFMLTLNNNEYELHCSSLFTLDIEKAQRLPDVFAKMVLRGIKERKIDVDNAIKMITV